MPAWKVDGEWKSDACPPGYICLKGCSKKKSTPTLMIYLRKMLPRERSWEPLVERYGIENKNPIRAEEKGARKALALIPPFLPCVLCLTAEDQIPAQWQKQLFRSAEIEKSAQALASPEPWENWAAHNPSAVTKPPQHTHPNTHHTFTLAAQMMPKYVVIAPLSPPVATTVSGQPPFFSPPPSPHLLHYTITVSAPVHLSNSFHLISLLSIQAPSSIFLCSSHSFAVCVSGHTP